MVRKLGSGMPLKKSLAALTSNRKIAGIAYDKDEITISIPRGNPPTDPIGTYHTKATQPARETIRADVGHCRWKNPLPAVPSAV